MPATIDGTDGADALALARGAAARVGRLAGRARLRGPGAGAADHAGRAGDALRRRQPARAQLPHRVPAADASRPVHARRAQLRGHRGEAGGRGDVRGRGGREALAAPGRPHTRAHRHRHPHPRRRERARRAVRRASGGHGAAAVAPVGRAAPARGAAALPAGAAARRLA
eukprot:5958600-Prymnesium_polylepis.2